MIVYKSDKWPNKGRHIHIFHSNERIKMEPLHTHDFIEIVYILSGHSIQTVNGTDYDTRHGDMLFLNYGTTHAYTPQESVSYINVCFSPETVGEAIVTPQNAFSILSLTAFNEMRSNSSEERIRFSGKARAEIEEILFAMLREYETRDTAWNSVIEHYLCILFAKMLRQIKRDLPTVSQDGIWQELSEYIDANLDTPLSLSALAGKCFYNPSYFSRVFKEKFGVSLLEYINRRRIDSALELLLDSALSVDEISARCGFADRRAFSNSFSKHIGCTPSAYRRRVKK